MRNEVSEGLHSSLSGRGLLARGVSYEGGGLGGVEDRIREAYSLKKARELRLRVNPAESKDKLP